MYITLSSSFSAPPTADIDLSAIQVVPSLVAQLQRQIDKDFNNFGKPKPSQEYYRTYFCILSKSSFNETLHGLESFEHRLNQQADIDEFSDMYKLLIGSTVSNADIEEGRIDLGVLLDINTEQQGSPQDNTYMASAEIGYLSPLALEEVCALLGLFINPANRTVENVNKLIRLFKG